MNWLTDLREQLHRNPEIAFAEHRTAEILLGTLERITKQHINQSAITAGAVQPIIHRFASSSGFLVEHTSCDGPYRLFRADMDALPVSEATGCDFASQNPNMMHACGHDIHMSVLMGLIEQVIKEQPRRNLLFLFQPAEEGKGGAESVLAEGILQQFNIEAVFALHVGGGMPVGAVSSRAGIFFGIPQEFDVRFTGKSAHVAFPDQGTDAIASGIEFYRLMREDMAELTKLHRVIFHVGRIEGGSIRNVIADSCVLEGTHRSLAIEARDEMNRLITQNARTAAALTGAGVQTDFLCSYDPVINHPALVEELKAACSGLDVDFSEAPIAMTGEDFGFFTTRWPGLLFWLGSGCDQPLHSPRFLPDQSCIEVGVKIMAKLAIR